MELQKRKNDQSNFTNIRLMFDCYIFNFNKICNDRTSFPGSNNFGIVCSHSRYINSMYVF